MEKNESNTGGKCGNCGDMTSTKCSRCKSTYYCNTNCQRTHWPAHKKTCQVSDVDTYIRRAGELLKAITLIFSEITYWNPVGKIDRSGKDLIVYDGYTTKLPGNFHKFPNNLVHGEDEKAMVLTVQMCEDVLGYFYDFTKDLLEGINCTMRVATVDIKAHHRRTRVFGNRGQDVTGSLRAHSIFLVKPSRSKTQWVIDPTGAQYSVFQGAMEWDEYRARYVDRVFEIHDGEYFKRRYKAGVGQPGSVDGLMKLISWDAVSVVHRAVNSWNSNAGLTLTKLLQQSDWRFQEHLKLLLGAIKEALRDFVAKADYEKEIQETARAQMTMMMGTMGFVG